MLGIDTFPEDDQTSQILAEMAESGIDLSQEMKIDFIGAFEFKETAEEAIKIVESLVISGRQFETVKLAKPEFGGGVELIASLTLVPTQEVITEIDDAFTTCIENLRGYSDGWGVELEM
ncbi:ribonuclease E inhibitor RraB [Catenovulum maritimum]|uniref:Regulator of ribonuclease activity B domain-containing protein n=1 Tax=Catenovulum maritimum TaxID=1513271 RepID=A0A0J8GLW5_9ALTE|nr:ribonuclease E inhibitor RraB [Catenovulum maritimum]KMT63785.1 hypothetical protein XM47_17890 [Catenovulum maritimum]